MHRPRICFAFIAGSSRFATLRATQVQVKEVPELADDSEHGKISRGIKRAVDVTRVRAGKLAHNAEWIFGRKAARVLGVVALLAAVVTLLMAFLDWYVAPTKPSEKKDLVLAVAQILGGTALLSGLYFTWRTLQVNREGQITERFTRAIDQIGSKELEIRLGGIYALERIARDSERDHWTIMEVLTAYVRHHAPRERAEGGGEVKTTGEVSGERAGEETELTEVPLTPGPDIKAIIAVLRRRTRYPKPGYPEKRRDYTRYGEPEPLDLSATELSGANFWHVYLRQDVLTEASLRQANLSGADLSGANLSKADLSEAELDGANLNEAYLLGADLSGVDLSNAQHLTQEQLEATIGDEYTQLPPDLKPPAHWGVKTDEQPGEANALTAIQEQVFSPV